MQVDDNLANYLSKNCDNLKELINPDNFPPNNASTMLQNFLFENKIENINLLPVFKRDKHLSRIYFQLDPHLSEYGNEVTFEAIKKFLNTEKFSETLFSNLK